MARIEPDRLPITVEGEGRPQTRFEKLRHRRPIRPDFSSDEFYDRHPNPRLQTVERPATFMDRLRYPTVYAVPPVNLRELQDRYEYFRKFRVKIQDEANNHIRPKLKFWDKVRTEFNDPDPKINEELIMILRILQRRGKLFRFDRTNSKPISRHFEFDDFPRDLHNDVLDFVMKHKLHINKLSTASGQYPLGSENKTPLFNSIEKKRLEDEEDDATDDSGITVVPLSIKADSKAESKDDSVEREYKSESVEPEFKRDDEPEFKRDDEPEFKRDDEFDSDFDSDVSVGSGLSRYPLLYSLSKPHIRSKSKF